MDKLRSYPFVVFGLAVTTYVASSGICLAQKAAAQAAPQPTTQNVNVVNTPLPVSVTGTPTVTVGSLPAVSITGTPTVSIAGTPAVSIAGTPAVSVTGTPTVTVGNTTLAVNNKDVDNPARQPVQHRAYMVLYAPNSVYVEGVSPSLLTPYTVPAGKRLVIDTISQDTTINAGALGGTVVVSVQIGSSSGAPTSLYVPVTQSGVYDIWGATVSVGTARVQAYADPGATVKCAALRLNGGGATNDVTAICMWSGHLVDLP